MRHAWTLAASIFTVSLAMAQSPTISSEKLNQMRYRYIGPVGNRVIAAAGIPGDPNVYYIGAASGGIFKTTDGGTRWDPIFDGQPVSSVGSLANRLVCLNLTHHTSLWNRSKELECD